MSVGGEIWRVLNSISVPVLRLVCNFEELSFKSERCFLF